MKKTFKVTKKDENGKEVVTEYAVVTPTVKDEAAAKSHYIRSFNKALTVDKALLKEALDDYMIAQGLWSEAKEKEYIGYAEKLNKLKLKLNGGNMSIPEGKKIALEMRGLRNKMQEMKLERTRLDEFTAQGIAENEKFNYLFSQCLVYNDSGEKYFKSYEDYLEHPENDEVVSQGVVMFMTLIYKIEADFQKEYPENKFLTRFKLVDENLSLIDKKGRLIDENGKLVNENGRYINEEGKFVDFDGNLVDEEGNYVVDSLPFLDEDGKPIMEFTVESTGIISSDTK